MSSTNTVREREFGADCVRIMAVCLLFWLHFYLRNGFYYTEVTDAADFIAVLFRPVFMCCVPLFMMLTGYLKCGKEWNRKYYRSLLPIIVSYILISIIHLLYKIFLLQKTMTAGEWILEFLGFTLADYSWYVGMYIGLFLVSPLLNILWNNLKSRRARIFLILTFAAVSFLVLTANSISAAAGIETNILPAYFTQLYYLTYYLIGCYIRTYRPKIKVILCLTGVLALAALQAAINIITRSDAGDYYSGFSASYGNLLIAAMTTLLFLAVYRLDCRSELIRETAQMISGTVLEMYLISYLFDSNIYPVFRGNYTTKDYLWAGLLMTLAVFLLSFISGKIINLFSHFICRVLLKSR